MQSVRRCRRKANSAKAGVLACFILSCRGNPENWQIDLEHKPCPGGKAAFWATYGTENDLRAPVKELKVKLRVHLKSVSLLCFRRCAAAVWLFRRLDLLSFAWQCTLTCSSARHFLHNRLLALFYDAETHAKPHRRQRIQ